MSAALDRLCRRCLGRWDDVVDGCVRCDDTGVEPLPPDEPEPRAPALHPWAIEAGVVAIHGGLAFSALEGVRRELAAKRVARALAGGAPVERAIAWLVAEAQIDEQRARLIVEAYARAVRLYGARRGRVREPRTARDRADLEVARACAEHAGRIVAALPWADAAE